jgi:hypothetical protein
LILLEINPFYAGHFKSDMLSIASPCSIQHIPGIRPFGIFGFGQVDRDGQERSLSGGDAQHLPIRTDDPALPVQVRRPAKAVRNDSA